MNELDQYISNLDALIRKLSPTEQLNLSRNIGQKIRQNNKQHIKANIAPSGAAFTPRQGIPSKPFKGNLSVEREFIYHGKLRRYRTICDYCSYRIGWEYHTQSTFKAMKKRIRLPSNSASTKLMFRKINQYKFLKLKATQYEAAIGFMSGLTAHIAAAHQNGEENRPERQLLGFSVEDLRLIEDMLVEYLAIS